MCGLKKNSKAIMSETLAKIIIILLVFIVLAIAVTMLILNLNAKSEREVCRASMLVQSAAINAPEGEKLVPPQCKTYQVVFFEDHVEINGKTIEVYDERIQDFTKKFNGLTDQIVNRVIAEEMRGCWFQFLEGKKKIFTRTSLKFQLYSPDMGFICDEIMFDSNVKKEEFTGLYSYLQLKNMSGTQITYYTYLAEEPRICESWEGQLCWEEFFKYQFSKSSGWPTLSDTVLKKDKIYYVVFAKHGREARVATIGLGYHENYATYILDWNSITSSLDSILRGPST